jgi:hypothetical protein
MIGATNSGTSIADSRDSTTHGVSLRWFVRGDKADQKLEVVVEVPPPGIGCYFLEGDATTDKP